MYCIAVMIHKPAEDSHDLLRTRLSPTIRIIIIGSCSWSRKILLAEHVPQLVQSIVRIAISIVRRQVLAQVIVNLYRTIANRIVVGIKLIDDWGSKNRLDETIEVEIFVQ